jgi:hypothetical protein
MMDGSGRRALQETLPPTRQPQGAPRRREAVTASPARTVSTGSVSSATMSSQEMIRLQRLVGNSAVCNLLTRPSEASPVVRRTITIGADQAPNTWPLLMKEYGKDKKTLAKIEKVMAKARLELGSPVEEERLQGSWCKIAANTNAKNRFDIDDEDLPSAIAASYRRSAKSAAGYQKRKGDYRKVASQLPTKDFEIKDNARNPTARKRKLETFDFDTKMAPAKKEQRHIATVLFKNYGGTEAQASLKKDGTGLHISTNENTVNAQMRTAIKGRKDVKKEARKMLTTKGVGTMKREDAMKDREVRHPLKLLMRLNKFLSKSGIVEVPPDVTPYRDGRHAEIRIKQGEGWSQDYYHLPAGTKYPCMGCALHFWSDGLKIGTEMGPLWLTDAALSTQLESELCRDHKIGTLEDPEAVGRIILNQYKTIETKVQQGMGKRRTGPPSTDFDADSESDLDDEEYKKALKMVDESDSGSESESEAESESESESDADSKPVKKPAKKKARRFEPVPSIVLDDSEDDL